MINTTFLSISEVAQELSLTRNDVKKLIDEGRLTAYNFGEIRVDAKDLEQFIENSKIRGTNMDNLINQAIMAANTYDGAIDAVAEILAAQGSNLSKRDLESRAIEMVVKIRPDLHKMEMAQVEAHRFKRMGY